MSEITVEAIHTYPIKSCAPIPAESLEVTSHGFEYDREWMVARPNGIFLSQRVFPQLALVETDIYEKGLHIHAPGFSEITIPLDASELPPAEPMDVTIFKKTGTAVDQGPEAAELFTNYLGTPARLLRSVKPRPIKPECQVEGATDETKFADGFPMLLTSLASLERLNQYSDEFLEMSRFRPNVVVDGQDLEAFDEDFWRTITIGNLQAFVVRACARCPIPDVDQTKGVRPPKEERAATLALEKIRSGLDPLSSSEKLDVFFGQNVTFVPKAGTLVNDGDLVKILERSPVRNFNPAV